jgi:hypothetical protein
MKIAIKIIGVLAVLVAFLTCSLGASRNFEDAEEVSEFEKKLENLKAEIRKANSNQTTEAFEKAVASAKKEARIKDLPSKSVFENSAMLIALLLVLSMASGVFLFLPRVTVSMAILGLTILASVALLMIAPDMGEKSRATNVQVAYIASLPALLAALLAFANAKLSTKKVSV